MRRQTFRLYGARPYRVAVVHGGPGAPGEMAPVARELSSVCGVIEPLETADSVAGEVEELREVLAPHAVPSVILIGHSWGAWLSFIFAARYPSPVAKLILVSSGPFDESYAAGILETRLSRLSEREQSEVAGLLKVLNRPDAGDKDRAMSRFGELMSKADAYDPIEPHGESIQSEADIYEKVWPEAAELRRSGRLLALGREITCPVVAIHGDYDPHPSQGVQGPLSGILRDFRFILLEKCGHRPWNERLAKDAFYRALKDELARSAR